jgi:hypothetical protein
MSVSHRMYNVAGSPAVTVALICICLAWPLIAGGLARAGNIFDDDWTPPKRAEKAVAPLLPPPDVSNSETSEPVAKPPMPPVASPEAVAAPPARLPPPSSLQEGRLPVPGKTSTAQSRKLFKEVFSEQLKDRSVPARRKLAQALLNYAEKAKDAPADEFVLFTGAIEAAEEGASLRLSFSAAEKLAKAFDVDEFATKVEAAAKVWSAPATPAAPTASVANVQSTFDLIDQLAREDDFAAAMALEASLQRAAGSIRDSELKSAVKNHLHDLGSIREARERLGPGLEKLKQLPDDPAGNFAVGAYLCFTRGQWEKGLPFLAKGDDAVMKALASAEVRGNDDSVAVAKLADGWWDAAAKMAGSKRTAVLQHAAALYRKSVDGLSGLRRLSIEKRLNDIPTATAARRIDLLEMLDPALDFVGGRLRLEDGILACDISDVARVEFPYTPPEEYDYRVSFTITKGSEAVCQICSATDRQFGWTFGGWNNTITGFDLIQGHTCEQPGNTTGKRSKRWSVNGQRYTSVVKVRKSGVEGYINDQLISSWKTDYSDMSLHTGWELRRSNTLGFGAYQTAIQCDFAEVIEVTGHGKTLR